MTTMFDDAQLLNRAKELDPVALRALHQAFYPMVARYIQYKVGDPRTAEDLCGEVFVRLLEALRRGKGWRESPRGWVMGIARNIVVDHYRQQGRVTEVALAEELPASETSDPTRHALQNERHRLLRQAIDHLTDEQREVVLMRFIKGFDIQDVAEALNKSPGAIKALQHRALRALATRLQTLKQGDAVER